MSAPFERSDEHQALVASAERFASDHLEAANEDKPGNNWSVLADLGWLGINVPDTAGGLGLPWSLSSALAEALGPALLTAPLLSHLSLVAYLLQHSEKNQRQQNWLHSLVSGDVQFALAHHETRSGRRFACVPAACLMQTADGHQLSGSKCAVIDADAADYFLVSCVDPALNEPELVVVPTTADGLTVAISPGFDGRSVADLQFDDVVVQAEDRLRFDAPLVTLIDQAQGVHAWLLASESLGISRSLLRSTHHYLAQREQFGIKLTELQVLQHRLVDMQLALTRFESQIELARFKVDEFGIAGAGIYFAAAKTQAARAGRYIGKQAVQLHGAIGMTDELTVGRYFKRLTANELLAGTVNEHHRALAARLQALNQDQSG